MRVNFIIVHRLGPSLLVLVMTLANILQAIIRCIEDLCISIFLKSLVHSFSRGMVELARSSIVRPEEGLESLSIEA